MSFLKKFINTFLSPKQIDEVEEDKSQYLPEVVVPVDELFTINFKSNGGKFIYCENQQELTEAFINILVENDWFEKDALTHEKQFYSLLKNNNLNFTNPKHPSFFVASCESLIADDGAILFCEKQLKDYKPHDLPDNIIIIAATSQITRTKSDGLREIKKKYSKAIPSNITAINCFNPSANKDFLTYGRSAKNLYLLLLEDL